MTEKSRIRVLVVDDSLVCREMIKQILESSPDIEVVGAARDGREAVEMVQTLKPSIVTMDIHMPRMGGIAATEEIMAYHPTPILVVSTSVDETGRSSAFDALKMGALDVLKKPEPQIWSDLAAIGDELIRKVKLLSKVKAVTHLRGRKTRPAGAAAAPAKRGVHYRIVAVGSSTGGPLALFRVLSKLPTEFPVGIVVAQHIADGFIGGLVEWLGTACRLGVREASEGDVIMPGQILLAPTGGHLCVEDGRIALHEARPTDVYKPSVDMLFSSVAKCYGREGIGVILTGMGADGASGMRLLSEAGATTIAQDEKTCAVFGMPKAAIEMQAAELVLPVDLIADELLRLTKDQAAAAHRQGSEGK